MKKVGLILLGLLMLSLVYAEGPSPSNTSAQINKPDTAAVKEATDNVVEKQLSLSALPTPLQDIIRVFTKFQTQISISELVVFSLMTILFFLTFNNMFSIFSPLSSGTGIITAFVMTLLTGVLGILKGLSLALLSIGDTIKWLAQWSTGALALSIVLIIALWALLSKISAEARRAELKRQGKEEGAEAGATFGFLQGLRNMMRFIKNK